MTLIDFTVDLLDGLLSDVEGRVEVTVTDDNVFLGAVELIVPGTGRTVQGTRGDRAYVVYEYRPLRTSDRYEGMVEGMIHNALTADEHWMQSAYQQARRAA